MATAPEDSKKAFKGSCHCGLVRYELALPRPASPEKVSPSRCNCTFCVKSGFTGIRPPRTDFTLLQPSNLDKLKEYSGEKTSIHHYFCDKCGIQVCIEGKVEIEGKEIEFFSVNITTLDQPQEGLNLSDLKLQYWDGKHDNWLGGPKETPWTGSMV